MLGTLLSRGAARGLGFAKLISVGNEADIGVGELVELLAVDAATRVILLFLETVRDAGAPRRGGARGPRRRQADRGLQARPLGAWRSSGALAHRRARRQRCGARCVTSSDCGIVRVDMLETLLEIPPLLIGRKPMSLKRPGACERRDHDRRRRRDGGRPARPARRGAFARRSWISPWRAATPRMRPRWKNACSPIATRCSRRSAPRRNSTRRSRLSPSSTRRHEKPLVDLLYPAS